MTSQLLLVSIGLFAVDIVSEEDGGVSGAPEIRAFAQILDAKSHEFFFSYICTIFEFYRFVPKFCHYVAILKINKQIN